MTTITLHFDMKNKDDIINHLISNKVNRAKIMHVGNDKSPDYDIDTLGAILDNIGHECDISYHTHNPPIRRPSLDAIGVGGGGAFPIREITTAASRREGGGKSIDLDEQKCNNNGDVNMTFTNLEKTGTTQVYIRYDDIHCNGPMALRDAKMIIQVNDTFPVFILFAPKNKARLSQPVSSRAMPVMRPDPVHRMDRTRSEYLLINEVRTIAPIYRALNTIDDMMIQLGSQPSRDNFETRIRELTHEFVRIPAHDNTRLNNLLNRLSNITAEVCVVLCNTLRDSY